MEVVHTWFTSCVDDRKGYSYVIQNPIISNPNKTL